MDPIRVLHFSDVLCVWAYVSQIRVDQLCSTLGENVDVEMRFCAVFGDARAKLEKGWKDRGGLSGYGAHVRDMADRFDHVAVHPDVWRKLCPASSLSCHLLLCAIRGLEQEGALGDNGGAFRRACWLLRESFFRDLIDVSARSAQLELVEKLGIDPALVEQRLDSGIAHAELSADHILAREYNVTVSPTMILNEGRQRLTGNVGFRVIEANVQELLRHSDAEQSSWC